VNRFEADRMKKVADPTGKETRLKERLGKIQMVELVRQQMRSG